MRVLSDGGLTWPSTSVAITLYDHVPMPGRSSYDVPVAVPIFVSGVGANDGVSDRWISYDGVPTSSVDRFQVRWTVPPSRLELRPDGCVGASGSKPSGANDSISSGRDDAVPKLLA